MLSTCNPPTHTVRHKCGQDEYSSVEAGGSLVDSRGRLVDPGDPSGGLRGSSLSVLMADFVQEGAGSWTARRTPDGAVAASRTLRSQGHARDFLFALFSGFVEKVLCTDTLTEVGGRVCVERLVDALVIRSIISASTRRAVRVGGWAIRFRRPFWLKEPPFLALYM